MSEVAGAALDSAGEWRGRHLGDRTVGWTDRDAILYALAVGARADQLDLVFENRLRVLPTFALTLAQWAPDVLGASGAFEVGQALHGAQTLEVRRPLPPSGELTMSARVTEVWDKGSAAIFDVAVDSDYFAATWSLFAPGRGDFGGSRGPGRASVPEAPSEWTRRIPTSTNQAVLYRLLGDRHHIHVDPEAAARIGKPRPILHGLASLATAALGVAEAVDAHPADLQRLEGRFSSAVYPGDDLEVAGWADGSFRVSTVEGVAIDAGRAVFS